MLNVTSLAADAEGINLDTSSEVTVPVIAVHVVPFVLYSIPAVTPVTSSLIMSRARPVGEAVVETGTMTDLMLDARTAAVAAVRTRTGVVPLKALRGIAVPSQGDHEVPSRLYSMAAVTPVIASTEALYTALGCAARAGIVIFRVAEAGMVTVALMRI